MRFRCSKPHSTWRCSTTQYQDRFSGGPVMFHRRGESDRSFDARRSHNPLVGSASPESTVCGERIADRAPYADVMNCAELGYPPRLPPPPTPKYPNRYAAHAVSGRHPTRRRLRGAGTPHRGATVHGQSLARSPKCQPPDAASRINAVAHDMATL